MSILDVKKLRPQISEKYLSQVTELIKQGEL